MTKESTALAPSTMKIKRLECEIKKVVDPTRYGLEDLSILRAPRRKHRHGHPERLHCAEVFSSQASIGMKASWIHHTSMTECALLLPPQRGSLLVRPMRKHATFSRIRTPMSCHQTTSMFQETSERMIKELTALAPFTVKITLTAPPE